MAQFGRGANPKVKQVQKRLVPHGAKPGPGAVEVPIGSPSQKLIHTIGGGYFNEPTFYGSSSEGLTDSARNLILEMRMAAENEPDFYWPIVRWAREELKLRTTVEVACAVGCGLKVRGFRKYAPHLLTRPDMITGAFGAYREMFGHKGSIGKAFAKGLGDCLHKVGEYGFARWDTKPPPFKDVLLMVKSSFDKGPVSKEVFEYVTNGKILDPTKTPVFAARERFNAATVFDTHARNDAISGRVNWEVLISKFPGQAKACWEFLIENDSLGAFAALRNLRNMELAGISKSHQSLVQFLLTDRDKAHGIYPYQFASAMREVSQTWALDACEGGMQAAIDEMPGFAGNTLVAVDDSGSMAQSVSARSKATNCQVAASLAACIVLSTEGEKALWSFSHNVKKRPYSNRWSPGTIIRSLSSCPGRATYGYRVMEEALKDPTTYDRIVFLSDFCCYNEGSTSGYSGASLPVLVQQYWDRRNRNCKMVFINVAGDSRNAQADPNNPNLLLLSGFSQQVFGTAMQAERGGGETSEVPTIQAIVSRYGLT